MCWVAGDIESVAVEAGAEGAGFQLEGRVHPGEAAAGRGGHPDLPEAVNSTTEVKGRVWLLEQNSTIERPPVIERKWQECNYSLHVLASKELSLKPHYLK